MLQTQKHAPVYTEIEKEGDEYEGTQLFPSSPKPNQRTETKDDISFTSKGYAPNKMTILFLVFATVVGCLAEFVVAGIIIKMSGGYYFFPIFAAIFCLFVSLYPANHIDVEPYPWFHVKWLVMLSGFAFLVCLVTTYFQHSEHTYLLTLKACVNEDLTAYYGEEEYKKSAYYCQSDNINENNGYTCSCVTDYESLTSDGQSCNLFEFTKYTCAEFITSLPGMMYLCFLVSLYLSFTTGILFGYSLYAYQHPSILSATLLRMYILHQHPDLDEVLFLTNQQKIKKRATREINVLAKSNEEREKERLDIEINETQITEPVKHRYDGDLSKESGYKQGHGTFNYKNGDSYTGDWLNNKKHGQGVYTYANYDEYTGEFCDGVMQGKGVYKYASTGDIYEGTYEGGIISGYGKLTYKEGSSYEGGLRDGLKHGKGIHMYSSSAVYKGFWVADKPHGKGKYTFPSGKVYKGSFHKGKMHGTGIMRFGQSNDLFVATFAKGELMSMAPLEDVLSGMAGDGGSNAPIDDDLSSIGSLGPGESLNGPPPSFPFQSRNLETNDDMSSVDGSIAPVQELVSLVPPMTDDISLPPVAGRSDSRVGSLEAGISSLTMSGQENDQLYDIE